MVVYAGGKYRLGKKIQVLLLKKFMSIKYIFKYIFQSH
jgi:hypothetical protein